MADIFDVIADPTRRDVLHLLLESHTARSELSVGEIVDRLGLTQPTVSKHLKVLRDHGLVSVREDGQHRYYSLDASPFGDVEDWVGPFVAAASNSAAAGSGRVRVSTAVAALPGAEVGQKVGRAVADQSHRARHALRDAWQRVGRGIRRQKGR
jgi:DNA-binding transcriptional ArsR family regulator